MAVKKILDDLQNALSIAQAGIKGTLKSLIEAQSKAKKLTTRIRAPKKKVQIGGVPKPKGKPKKKLLGKNPTDPNLLARSVIEAAIGEPLTIKKPGKKKTVRQNAGRKRR
jgi:hypothetical protein